MTTYDRRTTLARPDFAAEELRGRIEAPRYGPGERRRVVETAAALRPEPDFSTPIDTEAVFGEIFTVHDEMEGWAWGQLERDSYVGWLSAHALSAAAASHAPTHRIRALRTFVYPVASIKAPAMMALTFGSAVAAEGESGSFLALKDWGFVFAAHAAPADRPESDPVAVAERFLGVPYLWGGRTSLGLDCSALVQTALEACGIACPRDSDMQEQALGEALDPATPLAALRRGDLLFWKGHVALVRDAGTLIHATGHTMTVMIEGLAEGIARIAAAGSPLRTIRRIG